jgi:hypothetical protein
MPKQLRTQRRSPTDHSPEYFQHRALYYLDIVTQVRARGAEHIARELVLVLVSAALDLAHAARTLRREKQPKGESGPIEGGKI